MPPEVAISLIVLLGAALIGFELCRLRLPRIVLARLLHGIGVALETRPLLLSCLSVWLRVQLAVFRRALARKPLAIAETLIPAADACPAILARPIRRAINGLTRFGVRRADKIRAGAEHTARLQRTNQSTGGSAMAWMQVTAPANGAGELERAFDKAFQAGGHPADAALFERGPDDQGAVTYYFSPGAVAIFAERLDALGAAICDRPPQDGTRFLIGHDSARHMLGS